MSQSLVQMARLPEHTRFTRRDDLITWLQHQVDYIRGVIAEHEPPIPDELLTTLEYFENEIRAQRAIIVTEQG